MDLEPSPSDADASGTCTTLRVRGFVDLSTCEELVEAGLRILWNDSSLVLDLSEVHFMDASGVGALSALSKAAQRSNRTFAITAPSLPVRRLLKLLNLTEQWLPARQAPTQSG